LAAAKTDHEKTALQRQIDATDRQIDRLVHELYGLTEESVMCRCTPRRMKMDHRRDACATLFSQEEIRIVEEGAQ
jgi:hypothetical protein